MAKSDKRPRVKRTIHSQVDMRVPQLVKSSIYPWDSLVPQDEDDPNAPARNFLVECASLEDAEKIRSSIYSSGRNYFQKRGTGLMPLCRVVDSDGLIGVGCWAIPDVGAGN